MTSKRWCRLTCAMLLSALCAIIALVVIVDPFEIYHRALFYQPPYESETQMYSVAGVAKSYDYDSVIIGSSVTENCSPSVFDSALGGRFVKLCMNAGLSLDHAKVMNIAFASHDVRRVVYGLDLFAHSVYYTNQKAETPDYLYDDNLLNDVQYWLNKSILLTHIPRAFSRIGTPDADAARDSMYFWDPPALPGEAALKARIPLDTPVPEQKDKNRLIDVTRLSLEHNVLPIVRAHPETTFTFFFPPYSLLYWADSAADGNLEASLAQKQFIGETLLSEPNVQLYDFQSRLDWMANYSLYYDLIHYISVINDEMAHAMGRGENRVWSAGELSESIALLRSAAYALFPQE